MKEIILDSTALASRDAFHDAMAEALSFPDWYGRNLDALHDLLTALPEDTHLVFRNWAQAEAALGNYANGIRKALTHASGRNPRLTVEFR